MDTPTLLDVDAVARVLEVKPSTVRSYHKRGLIPKADQYFGRSPVWKEETIAEWSRTRKPARVMTAPMPNAELVGG